VDVEGAVDTTRGTPLFLPSMIIVTTEDVEVCARYQLKERQRTALLRFSIRPIPSLPAAVFLPPVFRFFSSFPISCSSSFNCCPASSLLFFPFPFFVQSLLLGGYQICWSLFNASTCDFTLYSQACQVTRPLLP
jgi:hypothetical protein